jgi:hypothetical protein
MSDRPTLTGTGILTAGTMTAVTTTGMMGVTMARHSLRTKASIRASTRVSIKGSMIPAAVPGTILGRARRAIQRMTSAMRTEAAMEGRGGKHVCSSVG